MKKKTIALLMAVVMLFGVTVGGTLAWLKAETTEVKIHLHQAILVSL